MKTNKLFIFVIFIMCALLLVGCKKNEDNNSAVDNYTKPQLTNALTVEYTNGDIKVTKAELFTAMKASNLIGTLVNMIDTDLLASKIENIETSNFYQLAENYVLYGKANIKDADKDNEVKNESLNNLYLNGYRTDAQQKDYIKLEAAKMAKAYEYVENAQSDTKNSYYVSDDTLKTFYDNNKYNGTTAKAIVISYLSENDFLHALSSQGSYAIYNSNIVLKNDANTPNRELDETNTTELSSDEIKTLFSNLWDQNYSNGFGTTLTKETEYTYETLKEASSTFATKLFGLKNNESTYFVTSDKFPLSTLYTVAYMVNEPTVSEFNKETVFNEYLLDRIQNASYVNAVMAQVRKDAKIEFTDRTLGYNYKNTYDSTYDYLSTTGDSSVAVKYNEKSLTLDQIYDSAKALNFESFLLYAAMPYILSTTPSYLNIFGSELDMDLNASLRKVYFANQVNTDLESNYKAETYKSEDLYLYQKYGLESVSDVVKYNYMVGDMINFYVLDNMYDVNTSDWTFTLKNEYEASMQALIDDYTDNYYNIKAYDLQVTIDADNNYTADDLTDHAQFDSVLNNFYTYVKARVQAKLDDNEDETAENTVIANEINKIVKEYKNATRSTTSLTYSEENALAYFKQYGLVLTYNQINSGNATTYISQGSSYTDEMNAALKTLFNDAQMPKDTKTALINDSMVFDKNGAHFLFVTYGGTKLSFKSTSTSTYAYDIDYKNEDEKMTVKQLAAAFYTDVYTKRFTSSTSAKDSYHIVYSDNKPSLTFTQYVNKVNSYYVSEYFYLQKVCDALSTTETQAVFNEFKTIFQSQLGQLVD